MTTQTSIFDPPISRKNDPSTSKEAEIKFTLSRRAERQRQVLALVHQYPGCTSGEYSRIMLKKFPEMSVRAAVESPHKRLPDLETKRLVFKGDKRVCRDSGYECFTYYCTQLGIEELTQC